jgi:subtilisin family serine protease
MDYWFNFGELGKRVNVELMDNLNSLGGAGNLGVDREVFARARGSDSASSAGVHSTAVSSRSVTMLRIGKLHLGASVLAAFSAVALLAAGATSAQAAGCVPGNTSDPWYIGCASELTWNYSLAQINANGAYTRGYTGQGVVTAIFDSGLDTGDNQFTGRIAGPGYDALTGKVGVTTDDMWHGTFVSGIIAANRDGIGMMGVAYGAQLLPIRIVNPDGSITLSDSQLAAAINYATNAHAKVFNNSWNSSTSITQLS